MKRYSIFITLILFVSFVNFHSLGRFYIDEPLLRGKTTLAYVNVRNHFDANVEGVSTKLHIYDLGLQYVSSAQDIQDHDNVVSLLFIPVPSNVPAGTYLSKLTVSNDKFRDSQHIYLRIK